MHRLKATMLIDQSSELRLFYNRGECHFVIPFDDMDIHIVFISGIEKYLILIGDDGHLILGWGPPDLPQDYPHLMELTAILSEVFE